MKRLVLFCMSFFILGLMFVTLSDAAIDLNKAAGIWLFEEKDGDTIKDSSKNGNNGTAQGTKHVAGKFGSALSLNGFSDRVVVPDSNSLNLQGAWTITAWVMVNKTETDCGHILAKRGNPVTFTPVANYAFRTDNVGKGWDAYFATNDTWRGIWNQGAVKPDQWFYMTATYDGKDVITIYENGVQIAAGAGMGAPAPANPRDVIIGDCHNMVELLDGTLDEVVLLGIAITPDDMKDLMNNGVQKAFGITSDKMGKLTTKWGSIKTYF